MADRLISRAAVNLIYNCHDGKFEQIEQVDRRPRRTLINLIYLLDLLCRLPAGYHPCVDCKLE